MLVSPRAAAGSLDRLEADVDAGRNPRVPKWWPFAGRYARAFADVIDGACKDAGKSVWVEKSPIHLRCIPDIVGAMPDACFIHVVRDGREVVASIFELCKTQPDRWIGQFLDGRSRAPGGDADPRDELVIQAIIARWNEDVAITAGRLGDPHHSLVQYDRLLSNTRAELEGLCVLLGLDFDESMLEHRRSAPAVIGWRSELDHMQRVFEPLGPGESKFDSFLSPAQQRAVSAGLLGSGSLDEAFPGR